MAGISKLGTGALLALVLVAACDSTSPASDRLLQVSGEVIEEGQAPAPPLDVDIQAWPALGSDGIDVATLRTDAAGRFTAELGPFPDPLVDSLLVRVTQNDCDLQLTTELRHRDLALGDGEVLVLPSIALSYRLPSAEFGSGQEMCGAIVTPFLPEAAGDYARLALWIDEVSDSVRGRWRLNHSASVGDDYGLFSGALELDAVILQLRPTQPTPCTGLQLVIPVDDNGSIMGAADVSGDGSCSVPSTTVRLFKGASLSELPSTGEG